MLTHDGGIVRGAWRRLLAQVPSQCALCHTWPARRLCDACAAQFAQPQPRCQGCALPLPTPATLCGACLRSPLALRRSVAAVDYAWPWTEVLAQFKFRADPGWAATLALLMAHTPWAELLLEGADVLLPIPLSRQRLQERGYNQALLLAQHLDARKTEAALLLRLHDTPAQSSLLRAERLRNLAGALAVEPLRAAQLQGRRVLLVDDVMTTGATLQTAALAVLQAGAAEVSALVLARTPQPQPLK